MRMVSMPFPPFSASLVKLTIPLYVEAGRTPEGVPQFTVRPLFFANPVRQHEKLERATHLIAHDLRLGLHELGKKARHDDSPLSQAALPLPPSQDSIYALMGSGQGLPPPPAS